MSLYEFSENDVFNNRIKTHPRTYFVINDNKIYYNSDILPFSDQAVADEDNDETIHHTEQGYLSLYEININRNVGAGGDGLVYPFITKQGTLESFSTISTEAFQGFSYGTVISGSYPMSSSISSKHYALNSARPRVAALKNTMNHYKTLSACYEYEGANHSLATAEMNLVSIPSIFYGSSIKKGSVKMNFYVTGSLIATIEDKHRNGELVQTLGPTTSGIAATGSIEVGATSTMFDNYRVRISPAIGASKSFIFSNTLSDGSTGTVDDSGRIVVQLKDTTGEGQPDEVAKELRDAINGVSGFGVTAVYVPPGESGDDGVVLTQDVAGTAGNTSIDLFDESGNSTSSFLTISGFGGGEVGSANADIGKVAGVVLYNEGFVALTGSWDISNTLHTEDYLKVDENIAPKWTLWGQRDHATPSDSTSFAPSSSWDISFLGTNYIPTLTMLAHAKQGDLNHSNNPTFIDFDDKPNLLADVGLTSNKFLEDEEKTIRNITKSQYANHSASFEKTTYISKIGIYDKDKNLIGIAKLATPVRKTESRSYTFKMKLDF